MEKLTVKIVGMSCGGCEKSVESILGKIDGIANVKADHSTNTATLEYKVEAPSMELLKTLVDKIGFKLVD